jgi:hypothetical protein
MEKQMTDCHLAADLPPAASPFLFFLPFFSRYRQKHPGFFSR